jgi:hypothetical protein
MKKQRIYSYWKTNNPFWSFSFCNFFIGIPVLGGSYSSISFSFISFPCKNMVCLHIYCYDFAPSYYYLRIVQSLYFLNHFRKSLHILPSLTTPTQGWEFFFFLYRWVFCILLLLILFCLLSKLRLQSLFNFFSYPSLQFCSFSQTSTNIRSQISA